jgi:hypothetical protein
MRSLRYGCAELLAIVLPALVVGCQRSAGPHRNDAIAEDGGLAPAPTPTPDPDEVATPTDVTGIQLTCVQDFGVDPATLPEQTAAALLDPGHDAQKRRVVFACGAADPSGAAVEVPALGVVVTATGTWQPLAVDADGDPWHAAFKLPAAVLETLSGVIVAPAKPGDKVPDRVDVLPGAGAGSSPVALVDVDAPVTSASGGDLAAVTVSGATAATTMSVGDAPCRELLVFPPDLVLCKLPSAAEAGASDGGTVAIKLRTGDGAPVEKADGITYGKGVPQCEATTGDYSDGTTLHVCTADAFMRAANSALLPSALVIEANLDLRGKTFAVTLPTLPTGFHLDGGRHTLLGADLSAPPGRHAWLGAASQANLEHLRLVQWSVDGGSAAFAALLTQQLTDGRIDDLTVRASTVANATTAGALVTTVATTTMSHLDVEANATGTTAALLAAFGAVDVSDTRVRGTVRGVSLGGLAAETNTTVTIARVDVKVRLEAAQDITQSGYAGGLIGNANTGQDVQQARVDATLDHAPGATTSVRNFGGLFGRVVFSPTGKVRTTTVRAASRMAIQSGGAIAGSALASGDGASFALEDVRATFESADAASTAAQEGGAFGSVVFSPGSSLSITRTSLASSPSGADAGLLLGHGLNGGNPPTITLTDVLVAAHGGASADALLGPFVASANPITLKCAGTSFGGDVALAVGTGVPGGCVQRSLDVLRGTDLAPLGLSNPAAWSAAAPELPRPVAAPL